MHRVPIGLVFFSFTMSGPNEIGLVPTQGVLTDCQKIRVMFPISRGTTGAHPVYFVHICLFIPSVKSMLNYQRITDISRVADIIRHLENRQFKVLTAYSIQ